MTDKKPFETPAKIERSDASGKMIIVEQIGSPLRRPAKQRATLVGLGLNKINRRSVLKDDPAVRGMISSVSHLVRVVKER